MISKPDFIKTETSEISHIWSSWTQRYKGEKAEKKEPSLPRTWKKNQDDQRDPYRRDITEYTPDWKDQMALLDEMLMRAKVQFINGDLTGATETYRAVEAEVSGKRKRNA